MSSRQLKPTRPGVETSAEYAPVYSARERLLLAIKLLLWVGMFYLIGQLWLFDWLADINPVLDCSQPVPPSDLKLRIYLLFVALPASLALLVFFTLGLRAIRVLRAGQHPLPGEKVLRPMRYRYGNRARLSMLPVLICLILILAVCLWGMLKAREFTASMQSESLASCASVERQKPKP